MESRRQLVQNPQRSQPGTAAPSKKAPGTVPPKQSQTAPSSESDELNETGESGGSPDSGRPPSKAHRLAHMLKTGEPLKTDGTKPPAGAGDDDDAGEDGGSRKSKPKKLNDLAEAVGLELDELYALEVASAADGSPITVQTLKDHHAKRSEFSVAQLRWEEERTRQNNELVRGNAELRELLQAIPRDKLDKGVLEKVQQRVAESERRERARTLEVITDWRDPETMKADLAGMGEWLRDNYGYPMGYLGSVFDHRALLMMRDAWKRDLRIKAAIEEMDKEPPAPPGKGKTTGRAPKQPPREPGQRQRGRAGLVALLED